MPEPVIIAENIGKRYTLGQQPGAGGYQRFSEVIMKSAKGLLKSRARSVVEEFWALKDVSFEINRGDVVGIIGRNGAGKSTLLKILSRITEPTSGRITLEGRVASLLEVGTGFHPELTGRENIYLNGAILGMAKTEIRAKFDEIVAFAEIEKFLDTPVKRYSSGMYVRLAFAVAAHLEPEILIVDEVLAVGDAQFQQKCLGKMQEVSASGGRTVLFVSHQLGMIRSLCTKGIFMADGKAVFVGPTDQAIDQYLKSASKGAQTLASQFVAAVTGPQGESQPCIDFDGNLVLHIVFKHLPAGNPGLNVSIRNESGRQTCLFSTNPHDGFALPSRPCRVRFSMPGCRLAPGDYSVDLAVTDPGFSVLETVPSAIQFSVSPRLTGGTWPYEARYGDFFPQHEWAVQ
jgi:lipopolysaccharide transport system ATP-binding protein